MNELDLSEGVKDILGERRKQIDKYQYTAEYQAEHPQYYADHQLQYAAHTLLNVDIMGYTRIVEPLNWDRAWFVRLCEKPQKDRIRIAAALLAAELDRLQYISDNNL